MRLDNNVRQHAFQSERVQPVPQLIIVGKIIGKTLEAADFFQIRAAESQRRSHGELVHADQARHQRRRREIGRDT